MGMHGQQLEGPAWVSETGSESGFGSKTHTHAGEASEYVRVR